MRREGSPFTGVGVVFLKEYADHLGSVRMRVLEILVVLIGVGFTALAIYNVRKTIQRDDFLFLNLFLYQQEDSAVPSLLGALAIVIPLLAIGLGFDAVNSEFNRRTMSRILAQPIYRDALLLGKFLAGLCTLATGLTALWLLIIGIGLLTMGVPPSSEEVTRGIAFLIIAITLAGVWLAIAMLFSVIFRSTATSALCALGLWLFLVIVWPMLVPSIAALVATPDPLANRVGLLSDSQIDWFFGLSRISPSGLFSDAAMVVLQPQTDAAILRTPTVGMLSQLQGMVRGATLPLNESLLLAWPQITTLIAIVISVFAVAYIAFQRQEVRA
ncbi:ABC transporter permease [Vineibacter terrae]|uniref:ABC transporter permease n=1 Tax=Vineibacter terrae TaxID=2586908 RepID=A0A5C8PEI5_9HYPH|nr:ABC transporter permease subunit [Vineibacter terrae]TXL71725.1 ABC transporter permease [Vineibacter terrae]